MSTHTLHALFAGMRSLVYVTFFFWVWAWLALSVRRYDAGFAVAWPEWIGTAALVVMALGAALAFTCVGFFVARGLGTPALFDPPREFIAVGPYRTMRNPMYIGALVLLAGYGLRYRSVSILLLAASMLLVIHLFVVLIEEPGLERRFGDSYREYKRAVNRWWPRWR